MNNYSKKVATALASKLIKEAYELKEKPKLSNEELKQLGRLREMARIMKTRVI